MTVPDRSRSASARGAFGFAHWSAVLMALSVCACSIDQESVDPPRDRLFFPSALAIDPNGQWLYVANTNADLKYSGGTVAALDLAAIDAKFALGVTDTPAGCSRPPDLAGAMACSESSTGLLIADATIRTGSFAGDIKVQTLSANTRRLLVPVRGDGSLTFANVDLAGGKPAIRCTETATGVTATPTECDNSFRVTQVLPALFGSPTEEPVLLPGEPFSISIDESLGLAYVAHLTQGFVSLYSIGGADSAPRALDFMSGLFFGTTSGDVSTFSAVPRTPGVASGFTYVTSPSTSRIALFRVAARAGAPDAAAKQIVPVGSFDLSGQSPSTGSSGDVRALSFVDGGNRAYALTRAPAQLVTLDTSLDPVTGRPKNLVIAQTEVCEKPALLAVDTTASHHEVWVACFSAGQVWAIQPHTGQILAALDVGRAPSAIALRTSVPKRLYVASFIDHTVSVVDLEPGQFYRRVALRIGGSSE